MVDVKQSEDNMLRELGVLYKRIRECKALMDLYMEGGLLMPAVASHLWEVLNGLVTQGSLGEDHTRA
jgi:hypothetical protein